MISVFDPSEKTIDNDRWTSEDARRQVHGTADIQFLHFPWNYRRFRACIARVSCNFKEDTGASFDIVETVAAHC